MRFAILGMSLSTLLDIHHPQDLLKGLLNTITEYDQSKEEGEKSSKMVWFWYHLSHPRAHALSAAIQIQEP